MLTRVSKWLLVLTLTLSIGAHWMFLQSVAWVGMIVSYSHGAPLTEALSRTFDGQHPCKLCKFVQRGKSTEKKREAQKPAKEIEKTLPTGRAFTLYPPDISRPILNAPGQPDPRLEPPPIPPPERA